MPRPRQVCRHCDQPRATATTAGAPWLIRCNECNHLCCPFHIKWRKVKGQNAYKITCSPKCILRKRKLPDTVPVRTGVNEWEYFHDNEPLPTEPPDNE
jgi:hypothetical protein